MRLFWFSIGFLCGLIFADNFIYAQSTFLDFGAAKQEDRQDIQQWYIEKEIRSGNNPYNPKPCDNAW